VSKYRLLLVDMDGVLWRQYYVIRENIEALKELSSRYTIVYMSNNSSRSRREYLEKIKSIGLDAGIENIYNSGYFAARYILDRGVSETFVIGEHGLVEELVKQGIPVTSHSDNVGYVVVGLDRYLTYSKLCRAYQYIASGALFIATNTDHVYPVGDHYEPGAGAIVAALAVSLKKQPDFIAGKPNPWVIDIVCSEHSVSRDEILVIGDNIETDILLGYEAGVDTMLVLTGISRREDLEKTRYRPAYVCSNLLEAVRQGII